MSGEDRWFDGYRKTFTPQREGRWKKPDGVTIEFRHGESERISAQDMREKYGGDDRLWKEVAKTIIDQRNGWATVAILYQRRKSLCHEFSAPKFWLFRMVKRGEYWRIFSTLSMDAAAFANSIDWVNEHVEFEEEELEDDGDDEQAA